MREGEYSEPVKVTSWHFWWRNKTHKIYFNPQIIHKKFFTSVGLKTNPYNWRFSAFIQSLNWTELFVAILEPLFCFSKFNDEVT